MEGNRQAGRLPSQASEITLWAAAAVAWCQSTQEKLRCVAAGQAAYVLMSHTQYAVRFALSASGRRNVMSIKLTVKLSESEIILTCQFRNKSPNSCKKILVA